MRQDEAHKMIPPNFMEMSEAEQDQWYLDLALKQIDQAVTSGKSEEWLHSLYVIKDYLWYLKK